MNEFDLKASGWEKNPMHWDRSQAIVQEMIRNIPLNKEMSALEFGAGTGIAAFLLKDYLKEITLMDSSSEMVKIINEKITAVHAGNLKALDFDLENSNFSGGTFDLIFTQMVLHHISDTEKILSKLYHLLNPGGYLAIADLYPEDGSFHGPGFTGHNGFDIELLSNQIRDLGLKNISHRPCFVIDKKISDTETRPFGVFLLIAQFPGNKKSPIAN